MTAQIPSFSTIWRPLLLTLFENAAEAAGKSPEKRGAASNRGDLILGAYLIGKFLNSSLLSIWNRKLIIL